MSQSPGAGDHLKKLDEGKAKFKNLLVRKTFDPRAKGGEDVFKSELDKLAEEARRDVYDKKVELAVAMVDQPADIITTEIQESAEQRLLRQAIQLISEQSFEEALGKLRELLGKLPGHHEAIYYTAYCQVHLDRDETALRTLLPLRQVRLDGQLLIRVQTLKDNIRNRMRLPVVLDAVLRASTGQYDELIRRLKMIRDLDPECVLYHFLLGGTLLRAEKLDEASAAVDRGLKECTGPDQGMLDSLKDQVRAGQCARKMDPARRLFKQGKYKEARSTLHRLDAEYKKVPLFIAFDGYLSRLDGGGGVMGLFHGSKAVADVCPPGSFADVDSLYFYLVGQEVREAKDLVKDEKFGKAEGILRGALQYCPRFPYLNYLCAGCLYAWMANRLGESKPPEISEVITALQRAGEHVRISLADAEIADTARQLGNAVQEALKAMTQVRDDLKAKEVEARPVNELIEEFQSTMKAAEGGIGSPAQFRTAYSRMKALKDKLPGVRKQVKSQEGREAVKMLSDAVDRNIAQLESMRSSVEESEIVEQCLAKFTSKMESLKKRPISNLPELRSAQSYFQSLRSEVQTGRTKCRSSEAQKVLDDLLGAIDGIIKQLFGG